MKRLPLCVGVLLLSGAVFGQTAVPILNIIVGASHLPLWLAVDHGLFEKQGLRPLVTVVDSAELDRRLGIDAPLAVVGAAAAIAATASGHPMKMLMPLNNAATTSMLMARRGVDSVSAMKGKRLAVARVGTGFWLTAMLALQHLGVDSTRDEIRFVEVGDLPAIVAALRAGAADAAVVDAAQGRELKTEGFATLLDMGAEKIIGVPSVLAASADYVARDEVTVERVVQALIEGIAFGLAPRNRDIAVQTLAGRMGLANRATADIAYHTFATTVVQKPYLARTTIENMLRVMAINDPRVSSLRADDLIDDRFVRRLDERGILTNIFRQYAVQ